VPRNKIKEGRLTPLELEIMQVLWDAGPSNVQAVQARLVDRELAYTTVQTMLNVLHRKGKVKRDLKNRTYTYRAVLSRQSAIRQAVGELIQRFFDGSADSLVLNLVKTRQVTPDALTRIHQLLAEAKEKEDGNG
jgi:predicted transcriptional regulator